MLQGYGRFLLIYSFWGTYNQHIHSIGAGAFLTGGEAWRSVESCVGVIMACSFFFFWVSLTAIERHFLTASQKTGVPCPPNTWAKFAAKPEVDRAAWGVDALPPHCSL